MLFYVLFSHGIMENFPKTLDLIAEIFENEVAMKVVVY